MPKTRRAASRVPRTVTFKTRKVKVQSPAPEVFFARGMAYSSAFAVTSTGLGNNVWALLNAASLTDSFNVDFNHNGNGELEYIGVGAQNFEGEILISGRRNAGSGAAFPIYDLSFAVDTGAGYVLSGENTLGAVETNRQDELGLICKYSIRLNPGDKVRAKIKQNPNGLGSNHAWLNFGLDHSLIVRP